MTTKTTIATIATKSISTAPVKVKGTAIDMGYSPVVIVPSVLLSQFLAILEKSTVVTERWTAGKTRLETRKSDEPIHMNHGTFEVYTSEQVGELSRLYEDAKESRRLIEAQEGTVLSSDDA